MNIENVRIGQVVRHLRKERGLTQDSLAQRLGLNQSSLCRIEQGRLSLTAVQGFRICQILGVPHYRLFTQIKKKAS